MNVNKDQGFPVTGEITDIHQIERIQEYIDNKILDSLGWLADSFDKVQQGITLAVGVNRKKISDRIKKQLQATGRLITKYQKLIDSVIVQSPKVDTATKQLVDIANNDVPLEISDINSGQLSLPNTLDGTSPAINPGIPVVPTNPVTTVPVIRTNPDTCEIERLTADGTWVGTGAYNQACLNGKIGTGPGGGDGGDGNNKNCNQFADSEATQKVLSRTFICGGGLTVDGTVGVGLAFPKSWSEVFGLAQNFNLDERNQSFSHWQQPWNGGDNPYTQLPIIATVTPSRSNPFNISPYSEDAEYLLCNKYNGGISPSQVDSSTTLNDLVSHYVSPPIVTYEAIDSILASSMTPPEDL